MILQDPYERYFSKSGEKRTLITLILRADTIMCQTFLNKKVGKKTADSYLKALKTD